MPRTVVFNDVQLRSLKELMDRIVLKGNEVPAFNDLMHTIYIKNIEKGKKDDSKKKA